jgi:hypothetical protein
MDMNESDLRDLERRLAASLHASAPGAEPDLADRLLRRTAVLEQRRGFFGLSLSTALAAAAVVVLAVALGLGVGYLIPRQNFVGGPSESPMPSSTPSPTPQETGAPSAVPSASASAGAFENGNHCVNDEAGYAVDYPADWWANEAIATEPGLTPIAACIAFAEDAIDLVPNSELPPDVAIVAGVTEPPAGMPTDSVELIDSREIEVAGRPATISEVRWTNDEIFFRAGDRLYEYRIQLPSGQILIVGTRTNEVIDDAAYENHKEVLDAMMETLELTG